MMGKFPGILNSGRLFLALINRCIGEWRSARPGRSLQAGRQQAGERVVGEWGVVGGLDE